MRTFHILNQVNTDTASGLIHFHDEEKLTHLALSREGEYVVLTASYGPMEIALRPRLQELTRALKSLKPVEGLQTTRQIGTSQSTVSLGLRSDGVLVLRPTITADASGLFCLNIELTDEARQRLFDWLGIA